MFSLGQLIFAILAAIVGTAAIVTLRYEVVNNSKILEENNAVIAHKFTSNYDKTYSTIISSNDIEEVFNLFLTQLPKGKVDFLIAGKKQTLHKWDENYYSYIDTPTNKKETVQCLAGQYKFLISKQ